MNETKNNRSIIANAVIWAAMIIAAALVMDGGNQAQTMMLVLIGGWFASHSLFSNSKQALRAECAFIRRLMDGASRSE